MDGTLLAAAGVFVVAVILCVWLAIRPQQKAMRMHFVMLGIGLWLLAFPLVAGESEYDSNNMLCVGLMFLSALLWLVRRQRDRGC